MADLVSLTASQLLPLLRRGQVSVQTLALACLARIDERESDVAAWLHLDRELILAQAKALDDCDERGPLHGLPIGVKDVLLTKDMPTTYNSPIYAGAHPRMDAAAVAVLRAAGALIFGKTDTVEFAAAGRRARTRNPHDPRRTPGGSSSGSAAAVADLHVPLALGTQTGGSIIRPASYCGTYALKPTWGVVSGEGARRYAPTLDTIGWFARSVEDLALLYDVFDTGARAREIGDASTGDVSSFRIAVCRTPAWEQAEPATQHALSGAIEALRVAGVRVDPLKLPAPFEELIDLHKVVMYGEARASFLAERRTHPGSLHEELRMQVESAEYADCGRLRTAYDAAAACRAAFDRLAAPYDAVLGPSTVGEAPLGLAFTGSYIYNSIWTLLHTPCINLPHFKGPAGLPVGLTLTGPRFTDRRLLQIAAAVSRLFGALRRR